ncbi:phytanoyl-CoA dioxygenase family protein [Acuticoccus sp.]|uniref:phytanoyl-CoA dioxygenase family protein n=1 Tax=Acuticoccus sp. TaxID=1904378 RepID=UPI003B51D4CB
MTLFDVVRVPLAAPAVLTAQKSFRKNPVIGSRRLNAIGLHRRRVSLAAALARRRRAALAPRLDPAERAAFDRDGIVVRNDALPQDVLSRVREELATVPRRAWEMRQGQTVNRVMPLPTGGSAVAELSRFVRRSDVRDLVGYAAGRTGHVLAMLQTIAVDPTSGGADPQAMVHADTFHPTAKFWLFLDEVGPDDGPFAYAPGSHRLTPERLAFEDESARTAADAADPHHAAGSFRLPEERLEALGYAPLKTLTVPANTFVVADTFGFHRRSPSARPTVRVSLYGIARRNPFHPWNGLDPMDLPLLRDHAMRLHLATEDARARFGRRTVYRSVGPVLAGAAPAA